MENKDTGILLNDHNIKLHRSWFKQMCKLIGINVQYRAPINGTKTYNMHTELEAHYEPPITVGCIYEDHPTQKTMRKLGWNAELADSSVLIHVPYDLKNLQAGAIFMLPAGLDNAQSRMFRVLRMSNIAVYPASITCELGPILPNTLQPGQVKDFRDSTFNLLAEEPGYD